MATCHHQHDLSRLIVAAEQAGAPGFAHLLRGVAAGRIAALLPVSPRCSSADFKRFARATSDAPAIALIGDDDYCDRGPAGFPVAERAVRWARSILLHAAAADVAHYEGAIFAAQMKLRALIIECSTATLDAWGELILRAPHRPATLVLVPHDGAHPAIPTRETVQ